MRALVASQQVSRRPHAEDDRGAIVDSKHEAGLAGVYFFFAGFFAAAFLAGAFFAALAGALAAFFAGFAMAEDVPIIASPPSNSRQMWTTALAWPWPRPSLSMRSER